MATNRCSSRVERLEHHPHAAVADHLLHLVGAQQAEQARLVGRPQEGKLPRVRRHRFFSFQLLHHLPQRLFPPRRLAQTVGNRLPVVRIRREDLQGLLTTGTGLQVANHLIGFVAGATRFQERL